MNSEINKKQKIIAVISIFILFLFTGIFLFLISKNNKEKNITLRNKVIQLQLERENLKKIEQIYLDGSPLSEITSKSFITLAFTTGGTKKILLEKEPNLLLPIASITKLMVAVVALENVNPDTNVIATLDYIGKEQSSFILETNKVYKIKELLANALISSDNDSARLISSTLGESNFIDKMNFKAKELNLTQTNFVNVTGLDPQLLTSGLNTSSVSDLANLLIYIKIKHPEILDTTIKPEYNFCDVNNFCKIIINTDKLLASKDLKFKIIGSKTGSTDLAKKNLAIMTEIVDNIFLINIVLGAEDSFTDTLSIINHFKINN